jgi:hypothetical protein
MDTQIVEPPVDPWRPSYPTRDANIQMAIEKAQSINTELVKLLDAVSILTNHSHLRNLVTSAQATIKAAEAVLKKKFQGVEGGNRKSKKRRKSNKRRKSIRRR